MACIISTYQPLTLLNDFGFSLGLSFWTFLPSFTILSLFSSTWPREPLVRTVSVFGTLHGIALWNLSESSARLKLRQQVVMQFHRRNCQALDDLDCLEDGVGDLVGSDAPLARNQMTKTRTKTTKNSHLTLSSFPGHGDWLCIEEFSPDVLACQGFSTMHLRDVMRSSDIFWLLAMFLVNDFVDVIDHWSWSIHRISSWWKIMIMLTRNAHLSALRQSTMYGHLHKHKFNLRAREETGKTGNRTCWEAGPLKQKGWLYVLTRTKSFASSTRVKLETESTSCDLGLERINTLAIHTNKANRDRQSTRARGRIPAASSAR